MGRMDKQEHGKRLAGAMAQKGADRQVVADATGRDVRTVTNWTRGKTMPSAIERATLQRLFPGYDAAGDPIEIAILSSDLTEDRRYALLSAYKKLVREQAEDSGRGRAG